MTEIRTMVAYWGWRLAEKGQRELSRMTAMFHIFSVVLVT